MKQKKLLVSLLAFLVSMTVYAQDDSFVCDEIYYIVTSADNRTVEVVQSGDELYSGSISIPSTVTYLGQTYTVTSIGDGAFCDCEELTSISIPNSVTSIGSYAFCNCYGLTSFTIPNSVRDIGEGALCDCSNILSIIIPEGVTCIDDWTFSCCFSLTSVTIPESVTSIGECAFNECSSLTSVTIPESVTSIGECAFNECSSLTSVTISEGVTSIGYAAFSGCCNLTSIIIPESVTSISECAFIQCSSLTSVTISEGVTSIGYAAFCGCSNLTSIIIPESVTSIGERAFANCRSLTSITILEGVTSIGWRAFEECGSLASVTLHCNNVGSWFEGVESIKVIVFGEEVTGIDGYAFSGCNNLTDVYCYPENVPLAKSYAFESSSIGSATLHVPAVSVGAYSTTNPWRNFGTVVAISPNINFADANVKALCVENWDRNGDGELSEEEAAAVTYLGEIFKENTTITSFNELRYFTGLTSIGNSAFQNCGSLISITIPEGVTSFGNYTFSGCTSLTSITIPEGITNFGNYSFSGCAGLTSVTIPKGVTSIDNYTFSGCTDLTSVTIPNSVTSIGEYAFRDCTSLTSVTIPNSVTSIGDNAFNECSGLTTFTIPNSITRIGDYTFYRCRGLTSITIPNSVTRIGTYAFCDCDNLTSVTVDKENPLSIGYSTFTNRTNATLYVPAGSKAAYETKNYWKEFKEIIEMPNPNSITVGSTGFATFCSPKAMDFSGVTDIKAYIASGFSPSAGTLVLTRVTEVPAGEGLYIVGTPGSYVIPETTTDMVYSNLLKGVTTPTTISPTEGSYTNFILTTGIHGVGFYTLSTTGELAAGKAYLQLPTASVANIKALNIVLDDDDDATGITEIQDIQDAHGVIYNLAGQRVNKAQKGLYIINGKKTLIK